MVKRRVFIYLASQSARRADLLNEHKIPFRRAFASYREIHRGHLIPSRLVKRHALGKAKGAVLPWVSKPAAREYVLGSDTIVWFNGKALGKPKTVRQAQTQLEKMCGKFHWVYSGIALIERKTGKAKAAHAKTRVKFKDWNKKQVAGYLSRINPLDKAGGYAIQANPSIVESYEGSLSNVIGLPMELLRNMLRM